MAGAHRAAALSACLLVLACAATTAQPLQEQAQDGGDAVESNSAETPASTEPEGCNTADHL